MKYGSAYVSNRFLASLLLNFEDKIHINVARHHGKDYEGQSFKKYYIEFESDELPIEGQNGHLDIYVENVYDLKFKSDRDV